MARFIDRQREFRELDEILEERGAHFIVVYGRRRVGKTTLLLHWVQHTGLPSLYWVARRETAKASRLSMARALWRWAYQTPPIKSHPISIPGLPYSSRWHA